LLRGRDGILQNQIKHKSECSHDVISDQHLKISKTTYKRLQGESTAHTLLTSVAETKQWAIIIIMFNLT